MRQEAAQASGQYGVAIATKSAAASKASKRAPPRPEVMSMTREGASGSAAGSSSWLSPCGMNCDGAASGKRVRAQPAQKPARPQSQGQQLTSGSRAQWGSPWLCPCACGSQTRATPCVAQKGQQAWPGLRSCVRKRRCEPPRPPPSCEAQGRCHWTRPAHA